MMNAPSPQQQTLQQQHQLQQRHKMMQLPPQQQQQLLAQQQLRQSALQGLGQVEQFMFFNSSLFCSLHGLFLDFIPRLPVACISASAFQ